MHKEIKKLVENDRATCTSSGCIKSMDGDIVMDQQSALKVWSEYIGCLYNDDRAEKPTIRKNVEGPPITKAEVRNAIAKIKHGKAAGPHEIVVEMIAALDDFGMNKVTEVTNQIYDSGEISTELSK